MAHTQEVTALQRRARSLGLTVTRNRSGHVVVTDALGRYTVIAGTPGSSGAIKRAKSHIRRLASGEPLTKDVAFHGAGIRASSTG